MKSVSALLLMLLLTSPLRASPVGTDPNVVPEVIAALFPAVVNITTLKPGDNGGPAKRGYGSGFIVDPAGYIVTSRHVLDGGYRATATLNDGRTFVVKVLATNDVPDIAVVKIDSATPLPMVRFGDSEALRRGETVIAVGSPLGLAGTVTVGVISALNRNVNVSWVDDFIQTDTSINQGNSGGPLLNLHGDVIGVNVAFVAPVGEGGSVGLGLAIPSNTVRIVLDHMRRFGRLHAGFAGMLMQALTIETAQVLGLEDTTGGIVTDIVPGGPAEKAGIRMGDVVLRFGDRETADARALFRELARYAPGTTVPVRFWRAGQERTTTMIVTEFPAELDPVGPPAMVDIGPRDTSPGLGLHLAPLPPEKRIALAKVIPPFAVLIEGVTLNSVAGDLGLGAGDLILRVDETGVNTPEEVLAALEAARQAGRKAAMLLVRTKDRQQWMPAPLGP